MSTISGYILRQTMAPLLATVALALLVLLTERMLRLLDLVLDSHGGLAVLLEMLAYLVPHYMALALPVAFFLGVLLAFSRLHQNHELDALGSAGVGLPRLLQPVLLLALALTVISAVNFSIGQPYARYIYRALVHDIGEASINVYLQERTFMEVNGVTFMAERIHRGSREFGGVFIYEENKEGQAVAMSAQRGNLDLAPKGERSTLFLLNGVRMEVDLPAAIEGGEKPSDFGVLQFGNFRNPIDLIGQDAFRPRGEDERELTLLELWRYRATPPPGVTTDQMLAEFHDRLVRTLSVLFLPFLAVPFAIGARRVHQAYGIAAGLLILVGYNQLLSIGKSLASIDQVPALLGQWLPFLALAAGSSYLFYRSAYLVGQGSGMPSPLKVLDALMRQPRARPEGGARPAPK